MKVVEKILRILAPIFELAIFISLGNFNIKLK